MSDQRLQKFHTGEVHYPDLGSDSDWLKQISFKTRSINQKHYPDLGSDTSSVWNFCNRPSVVISGETSGRVTKCLVGSQIRKR